MINFATAADVPAILAALRRLLRKSPAPQMKYAKAHVAEASVRRAIDEGRGFLVYGYFIMVEVGSDWYTDETYLIEQILIRVYDSPYDVRYAVHELDIIREHFGCVMTVVGDTQIGHMTPIYEAAGYTKVGTQLIKGEPSSAS